MPSAEKLASGLAEVVFDFKGDTYHVIYKLTEVTQQFKAQSLLLGRQAQRIEQRQVKLMAQIQDVSADEGTPEAEEQDRLAETAIAKLLEDDATVKRSIGRLITAVVSSWDVTNADGTMYGLDEDSLFPMRSDFLAATIQAITQDATVGEANASSSQKTLPSQSRQEELLVIGRLSPNSMDISSPANGAQQ